MGVYFTKHAREKFGVLVRHKFKISETQVIDSLENPDLTDFSRLPLLIAQKKLNRTHVLRVVYRQEGDLKIIITFYPGRRKQYEKKN